jgi:hypothetical protein
MTSVRELLAGADLVPAGRVRWGTKVPLNEPGVYVVATTDDPEDASGLAACPLDGAALRRLLLACPLARIDDAQATEASLAARLSAIWVKGEPVVYIGLASASVTTRVGQYYRTAIGASGPHAGGWPVKMLVLDHLWVHYTASPDPDSAEKQLIDTFAAGLPDDVAASSLDRKISLPFANLMDPRGPRKRHGFSRVRAAGSSAPGVRPVRPEAPAPPLAQRPSDVRPVPALLGLRTQTITPVDIKSGRIRVPSTTKKALPLDRGMVDVDLLGETVTRCRWDPRYGPDRDRSGTISIPAAVLRRLVRPGTQLTVTPVTSGVRLS